MELADLCQVKDIQATIVQLEAKLRQDTGLSLNQSFAVCCLAKKPLSPTQLAAELRIALPSLSRIVSSLVAKGLLRREHSGDDARQTLLVLTEQGHASAKTLRQCEAGFFPATVTEIPMPS